MSDDPNLRMLHDAYAEWGRGEFKRTDMFHPEVEFVHSGIEPQTFRGPEVVSDGWFEWLSAWDDFRVEAQEIIPGAQPGSYVVFCHLIARGKESGVPTEAETANVIWMRDGTIRRMELHWNRGSALEAAEFTPR